MKELFLQYTQYNAWANKRIIDVIEPLNTEVINTTITSSFSSLRLTLLHMLNAENIWWQRIKLQEVITHLDDTVDIREVFQGLQIQNAEWVDWVAKVTTSGLEHVFAYQNSKKEQFKQPVYQVLLHIFNHQTYHRGQLVTMLNQLNVAPVPSTDFIFWSRSKK